MLNKVGNRINTFWPSLGLKSAAGWPALGLPANALGDRNVGHDCGEGSVSAPCRAQGSTWSNLVPMNSSLKPFDSLRLQVETGLDFGRPRAHLALRDDRAGLMIVWNNGGG